MQDETKLGLPAGTPSVDASCHKILSKVAYVADPDGNWIELVPRNIVSAVCVPGKRRAAVHALYYLTSMLEEIYFVVCDCIGSVCVCVCPSPTTRTPHN